PMLRYGLAACWLNRADALMRLQTAEQTQSAIHSYDEALGLLRDLPLHEDARFAKRLAIAHQNRGLALQAQDRSAPAEAMQEFAKAIEILEHEYSEQIPDRHFLLAAVWLNVANTELVNAELIKTQLPQASVESEQRAADAASRAVALVA